MSIDNRAVVARALHYREKVDAFNVRRYPDDCLWPFTRFDAITDLIAWTDRESFYVFKNDKKWKPRKIAYHPQQHP